MALSKEETRQFVSISAFETDDDLEQYQPNSYSIFALSHYLRLEDVQEFAADAITEGLDDKKVDICYIDENEKRAIIVQSYFSGKWGKLAAPVNKARDLHTAIAWLLSVDVDRIPSQLKTKATELRNGLMNGTIKRIEIFYIHNCYESENVHSELMAVTDATSDIVSDLVGTKDNDIVVISREMGLEEIEDLFRSRDSDIVIDDWIIVPVSSYIKEQGTEWKAILTTVSGDWIRCMHRDHGDRLFSANYRDYMGYARRQGNINFRISQTAESEPINFWVYNNGITALTHELQIDDDITIRGISIINGAQTTGALSEVSENSALETKVLIRIVECRSEDLIDKIIRYNNTQNEIKPADRRSNDFIQRRLNEEFSEYGIMYVHRRSSSSRTSRNAITAAAIAPALCAFHGDPQTAYRNSKEIFNDDKVYQKTFPSDTHVEHVFLVKTLSDAIDRVKYELKTKVAEGSATRLEDQQYEILKYSAAKHFFFYLIGALAEEIMNRRVSNLVEWKCKKEVISPNNSSMSKSWETVLRALLPFVSKAVGEQQTTAPNYDVPRSADLSKRVAESLQVIIASQESILTRQLLEVRRRTTI